LLVVQKNVAEIFVVRLTDLRIKKTPELGAWRGGGKFLPLKTAAACGATAHNVFSSRLTAQVKVGAGC
jgi:hypothetical protein